MERQCQAGLLSAGAASTCIPCSPGKYMMNASSSWCANVSVPVTLCSKQHDLPTMTQCLHYFGTLCTIASDHLSDVSTSHQRWHTLFLSVIKKIISLSLVMCLYIFEDGANIHTFSRHT